MQKRFETSTRWLFSHSEVKPGASAILAENRLAFFAIHHIALCIITVSTLCSVIVIFKIIAKSKRSNIELDFPVRLPFYLAIAEVLWGASHFMDHYYLVTVQRFPESKLMVYVLCISVYLFFGYQQLMHASVAAYTYLHVIHQVRLDLGNREWKLHLICWSFLISSAYTLYYFDTFGPSGYWMGPDVSRTSGMLFMGLAAMTATLNACCTTYGYYRIRRKMQQSLQNQSNEDPNSTQKLYSTTTRCLSTYVRIAAFLYCPMAILFWIKILFAIWTGLQEPFTSLLLVIVPNSSGWANCYGYFRNERIRKKRFKQKLIEGQKKTPQQPAPMSTSNLERETEETHTGGSMI